MKKIYVVPLILIFFGLYFVLTHAQEDESSPAERALKNADPFQAIALANELKWSNKEIKSYVNSREVTFKFPDGKVDTISLPKDRFYVAVAPYINHTHQ